MRLIALTLILYIVLFVGLNLAIIYSVHRGVLTDSGQFGDSFGATNAFFAGLAFLGVGYSVYLQRKELRNQEKANENTRKDVAETVKLQQEVTIAQLRQVEWAMATAQFTACGIAIERSTRILQNSIQPSREYRQAFADNSRDLLRYKILMHKYKPELGFDWKPFLLDLLKSHMGVVASYKQLIQFYSTVPEDDLRSKKASSYKREDVIIQILNSWYTCLELIDVTKEPRLHIGIKNAIPRISYLWDAHEKSGQPMADACFDDADQFLVEMSELLSE